MIHYACRHFRTSRPCMFNKSDGSECCNCTHTSLTKTRVLIIKLDAVGDVLRTASIVPIISELHESAYIAWLTCAEAVALVGMVRGVDEVIELSVAGLARVSTGGWDHVYSLSNDLTSASLASLSGAAHPPIGFSMQSGSIRPSNEAAQRWLMMASFDRLKRDNTVSYQQIMLDIIGHPGPVHAPDLSLEPRLVAQASERLATLFPESSRQRVAVNIGSGARWPKKMLEVQQIAQFCRLACARLGIDIILVGGARESARCAAILEDLGSDVSVRQALTPMSIPEFVSILSQVDALLCGDTLALHVASAIRLPTVCVFGPTSAAEIPSFEGLVAKTQVDSLDCLGCYGDCLKVANCMSLLGVDHLVELVRVQLSAPRPTLKIRPTRPPATQGSTRSAAAPPQN